MKKIKLFELLKALSVTILIGAALAKCAPLMFIMVVISGIIIAIDDWKDNER